MSVCMFVTLNVSYIWPLYLLFAGMLLLHCLGISLSETVIKSDEGRHAAELQYLTHTLQSQHDITQVN